MRQQYLFPEYKVELEKVERRFRKIHEFEQTVRDFKNDPALLMDVNPKHRMGRRLGDSYIRKKGIHYLYVSIIGPDNSNTTHFEFSTKDLKEILMKSNPQLDTDYKTYLDMYNTLLTRMRFDRAVRELSKIN